MKPHEDAASYRPLTASPYRRVDEFLAPKLAFSDACGLCLLSFRRGDAYKSIWAARREAKGERQPATDHRRRGYPFHPLPHVLRLVLGITVHQACFAQLAPGDLARLFAALEGRLRVPLSVLRVLSPES